MKLKLDTTIQIHRLLNRSDDTVNQKLESLKDSTESIEASTYSKKEYNFSVINDCCTMLARVKRTKSLKDALDFINHYGSYKSRFRSRMTAVMWKFYISNTIKSNWVNYNENERDKILGEQFAQFLRMYIPIFWESFENGLNLPLQDRTKCPFAHIEPRDNGKTFELITKRKCKESSGCALKNLIMGERIRGLKLLAKLKTIKDEEKTEELKKIQIVLERFFEGGDTEFCYEMCNQGIGDMIIALETHADRTLVTTNAKESRVISPAICQECIIIPVIEQCVEVHSNS